MMVASNVGLVLLLCVLSLCHVCPNAHSAPLPNATFRATQALGGFLSYYWKSDPNAEKVKFFFSCGQLGGMGDSTQLKQCTCVSRKACINCYRWWDAIAMEAVANYGIYTKTRLNSSVIKDIFAHSPYNSNFDPNEQCTYIDDFAWYGMAYLRAYEWLEDPRWLERSVALYNWTWQNGWDHQCGGFWWMNCGFQFKDSITIVEIMHLASKLSYLFPHEERYLTDAQKIWDWFFSFDNGSGLMSEQYLVSTGAVPEKCCNSTSDDPLTRCSNTKISGTSYNQGLLMSSSAFLYKRTGNKNYLSVGLRALEAIFQNYTSKDGILIDEPRGYQSYQTGVCAAWSDPGGDWYSFNGIFMNHLSYFTTLLADNITLSSQVLQRIKQLVQLSSDAAWSRSAVWPPFTHADACNTGPLVPTVKYPKFHWWWGQNVTIQPIVPPDPRMFFHKTQLRCITVGNNTQLWEGLVDAEDDCMNKCASNPKCSKYLYQTDQRSVPGTNCWIWSYNRSDHTCSQGDSDFTVGIKRPVGSTCVGRCNSNDPVKLRQGVCYCDSECTKHLDCCLDYADHCTPNVPITCKGLCGKIEPRPVRGGGYCWCVHGCTPWSTDNNIDGSCCSDYGTTCQHVSIPTCLDARSQGSALHLFLAHLKMTQIK